MGKRPIIHRHSDSFDDRNMVLHLALGLASVNETLRGGLWETADPEPATAESEALTDFLVGLIHLTDSVTGELNQQNAPPAGDCGDSLQGVSDHTERTLLR